MKEYIQNFIYFINNTHYLKELSKENNQKILIEKTKKQNKLFCFQLLLYSILSIIISNIFSYIFQFDAKKYNYYLIIILSMFYYYIFHKVLYQFLGSYNYFIKLCESIIKYENIIKNKIKVNRYLRNDEDESINNLLNMINIINKLISSNINSNSNNYKNKNIKELYNEYQKIKTYLFKYIFEEYEKEYINKESYINIYMKYINNHKNNINYKMQYLIIEFNKKIEILNKDKNDYGTLIKEYEKYINNNVIKIEEIKKNELKNKIYDLLKSNFELNEKFIELIKEINLTNDNNEKINQIIEYIIEKKQLSISLLEQFKKNINHEKDENNLNNFEIKRKNNYTFINNNNFSHDDISYYDINLNNININKSKSNNNKNNRNTFNNNKSPNVYDIINEQEKIKDLKASFIDELNDYCKKVKGLNKEKEEKSGEDVIENEIKKDENFKKDKRNNVISNIQEKNDENGLNMPYTKLDFAKSLTLALSKNKNLNLNFVGEKDENDK